jgi:hypothetical protein
LLATATFSNESASGWQQVNLASPASITVNPIYIASYHTNGNYSADNDYFGTTAHVNSPLTAPATGSVGGNGVYAYGSASTFPTKSLQGNNYWVDVVSNLAGGHTQPPVAKKFTTQYSPLTVQASI